MRKDTTHEGERRDREDTEDADHGGGNWPDAYPSTTVKAVPIDEVTAGVDVTRYDLDDVGAAPMFEISENYPPEDDVEEEQAVYFHGPYAAAKVAEAINHLLSGRFDEVPFDEVDGRNGDR